MFSNREGDFIKVSMLAITTDNGKQRYENLLLQTVFKLDFTKQKTFLFLPINFQNKEFK